MVETHPKEILGPWTCGFTLDKQTLHSTFIGNDYGYPRFDNKRSEIGELLYQLKSNSDKSVLNAIVGAAGEFVRSCGWPVELVVPVPPSNVNRSVQPSILLAEGLGAFLDIPVCCDGVVKTKRTPELKNITDGKERRKLLDDAFRASESDLAGKKVLLVDDLYRSGATMSAVTNALYEGGKAEAVFALALTKTRSLR